MHNRVSCYVVRLVVVVEFAVLLLAGNQMVEKEREIAALTWHAQRYANICWVWAACAAAVWYFWGWWSVVPGVLGVAAALNSMRLTRACVRLERSNM